MLAVLLHSNLRRKRGEYSRCIGQFEVARRSFKLPAPTATAISSPAGSQHGSSPLFWLVLVPAVHLLGSGLIPGI